MVTIIRPKSAYLQADGSDDLTMEWSTNVKAQSGYEILYKKKGEKSWSTLGRVDSEDARTFDLSILFEKIDFQYQMEIYYRVILYHDSLSTGDIMSGAEISDSYSLMIKPPYSKSLRIFNGNEIEEYPLFDNTDAPNTHTIKVQTTEGTKEMKAILVEEDHPAAGNMKVKTRFGRKAFSTTEAKFAPEEDNEGEIQVYHERYTPIFAYNEGAQYQTVNEAYYGYKIQPQYTSYLYKQSSFWYTKYNIYNAGNGGFNTLYGGLESGVYMYKYVTYSGKYVNGKINGPVTTPGYIKQTSYGSYYVPSRTYYAYYNTYAYYNAFGYKYATMDEAMMYAYSYGDINWEYSKTDLYYTWYAYGNKTIGYYNGPYIAGYTQKEQLIGYHGYAYITGYRKDSYSYMIKT